MREGVLTRSDLARAQGVAFFNSLRGWLDARVVDDRPELHATSLD